MSFLDIEVKAISKQQLTTISITLFKRFITFF
jgi:hypothetical protein